MFQVNYIINIVKSDIKANRLAYTLKGKYDIVDYIESDNKNQNILEGFEEMEIHTNIKINNKLQTSTHNNSTLENTAFITLNNFKKGEQNLNNNSGEENTLKFANSRIIDSKDTNLILPYKTIEVKINKF